MALPLISLFWNMKIKIEISGKEMSADLGSPIDISIPLSPEGPRAWYVDPLKIEPVINDRFTGSVALGGDVNFRNIFFNPHGHGTHTESVGHIDRAVTSVNGLMKRFFYDALLITLEPPAFAGDEKPYRKNGDRMITVDQFRKALGQKKPEAVVLRTLPNQESKKTENYSGTNPAYLEPECMDFLRESGVMHLLLDLPSVDREEDGGKLEAHHRFWQGGRPHDELCTITEFIFVPNEVEDGRYLLEIQMAPFENDATPSRPVLYILNEA